MGYRYEEQSTPPEADRVTDVAVTRFDGVYEVDPSLMVQHVNQQTFPNWDTLRIVHSRHDHLQWMHEHWAAHVVSGEEILGALDEEEKS
jgi:hypothetical protein